jgi:hypothetical protein
MTDPQNSVPLHPSVVSTEEDWEELPLRRFNVVILVEPDLDKYFPTQAVANLASMIWEDVTEELTNYSDDPVAEANQEETSASEVDIVLAYIGTSRYNLFFDILERAYITFPQGLIQPYYDVLRHMGYWLAGVHQDHPHWTAAIIGANLEEDVARVANKVAEMGWNATILERYCIPREFFQRNPNHRERPDYSYGEVTQDKLLQPKKDQRP